MYELIIEKQFWDLGHKLIGATDEVGRGPLAGPVVAACVVVDADFKMSDELLNIKDSKALTEKKREKLFDIIMDKFPGVGIGICDHDTVDRINILEASFLAMKKAIGALREKPDFILVDGKFKIPNFTRPQKAIIKGDKNVFSIAAASIIAKVTRDRMMKELHEKYPEYGFDRHKGYGTKIHIEALTKHGPCLIHRRSFAPVRKVLL